MSEPQPGGTSGPGPSFRAPAGPVRTPDVDRTPMASPLTTSPLTTRPLTTRTLTPELARDPSSRPTARDFSPPRRWLPAVLTVLALVVVGGVVAVASLRPALTPTAQRPIVAPVRLAPAGRPTSSASTTQVPFSTAYGEGVLTVIDHRRSASGRLLVVTVTVTALRGQIEVEPTSFAVLDAAGATHELSFADSSADDLEATMLQAGQSITGRVRFEVPPGQLVLLMEDPLGGVTALKIPE